MSHLWGHPGSGYETHSKLHYPDFVGAAAAAAGIMAALEHRTQTGRGQYVEVDQSEALLSTMGVAYLDYFANLREPEPTGNRSHAAAPHGCYPCIGDDQWCVVECWDEDQWQGLCEAIDMPELADDSRFVDLQSRLANQDALDDLIGEWTRTRTPLQVMRTLQQSGVPAGAVQSGEQLYHDYRLHDRGFIVEESRWDAFGYTASPVHMSDAHHAPERRLPNLGEHNDYVYSQILGESPEHVTQLVDEGVIA